MLYQRLNLLREKLGHKAKSETKFRFYSLYGHICREEVLRLAWHETLRNKGSAGVDGVSFQKIINSPGGVEGFLKEIEQSLRNKTYRPLPVKRVYIPKANGKKRPLGIPCIRDRVVQAAVRLIIEPIFEARFLYCSYGFRPQKSAHEAVSQLSRDIWLGKREIYDADLKACFDTIPHKQLMAAVKHRIADGSILNLIHMWLVSPVMEENGVLIKNSIGTPQGSVISPLLANIYLHWFDISFHWKDEGPYWRNKAGLIRYADDFVVTAKVLTEKTVSFIENIIENRLKLTINREKTSIKKMDRPGESINFLGFTIRYQPSRKNPKKKVTMTTPSKEAVQKARDSIKELTSQKNLALPFKEVIRKVNSFLRGWREYFRLGQPSNAFSKINRYVNFRLVRFLMRKGQKGYKPPPGMSFCFYLKRWGLYALRKG